MTESFTQHITFVNTKKSLPEDDGIYLCVSINGVYQLLYFTTEPEKLFSVDNFLDFSSKDSCFYFFDREWGDVIYPTKNIVAWAKLPSDKGLLSYFMAFSTEDTLTFPPQE